MFKNLAPYFPMVGMLAITGLVTANLRTLPSSADDGVVSTITVTVQPACTLSSSEPSESSTTSLMNNMYYPNIYTATLTSSCNDTYDSQIFAVGYTGCDESNEETCTKSTNVDSNGINNNTKLLNSNLDTFVTGLTPFPTNGEADLSKFTTSGWYMKITPNTSNTWPFIVQNSFEAFHTIPTNTTLIAKTTVTTNADPTPSSSIDTTYSAYIDGSQAAGSYQGKVKYTLIVSDDPTMTFDRVFSGTTKTKYKGYYTLQDTDQTICSNVTPGQTTSLIDTRDDEVYMIGKLADDNCWLLDNLRLDTSTVAMTVDDTNMKDGVDPKATNGTVNSAIVAQINTTYKDDVATVKYGLGSGEVGVYYNFCAASAGTICMSSNSDRLSASYDICPAGWRMPTGGESGEYQALYTAYSSNDTNFRNALSTPLSGYVFGSQGGLDSSGVFWASTCRGDNYMYGLSVNSSNVSPQGSNGRYVGLSVRCVLK